MARKCSDDYTHDLMVNEVRLTLDPDNIVARLLLKAAQNRLPQSEIANVLGISIATYHMWQEEAPVIVGVQRERIESLLDWIALVVGAHSNVRSQLASRAALGDHRIEEDNGRSTLGEQ